MQHIADASANGVIRRSLLAATIGLVAIFASIVIGQPFATDTASAASATSGEGPQVSLICKRVTASGLALCRLTSVEALEVGDQVTFQASTPDGSQQDVTIEYQGRVGFRDAPSCDGPAACYVVWFRMQQAGANQVAITGVTYQPVGSTAPETIIEQPETQAVVSAASPTISPTSGSTQQAGVQTADETGDQSNGDQSASGQATSAQTIESGGAQAQIGASQEQSKPTKQRSQQQSQQQAQASQQQSQQQSQQAQGSQHQISTQQQGSTQQQVSTQQQGGQAQSLSQQQQPETRSESQTLTTSSSSGSQAGTSGNSNGGQTPEPVVFDPPEESCPSAGCTEASTNSQTTVTIKAEETDTGTKVVVTDDDGTRTHDSTNEAENDEPQEENEEWKKEIEKAVDDGKTVVISTGVGTGTPSEQFTTIQIEDAAAAAGEPYEVCIDHPEHIRPGKTVVSGGKTITIDPIVTPAETICHMVTPE